MTDLDRLETLGKLARKETFEPGWPYGGSGEWTENVIGMLGGHTGNFAGACSPDVIDELIGRVRELEAREAKVRELCTEDELTKARREMARGFNNEILSPHTVLVDDLTAILDGGGA